MRKHQKKHPKAAKPPKTNTHAASQNNLPQNEFLPLPGIIRHNIFTNHNQKGNGASSTHSTPSELNGGFICISG